MAAAAHNPKFAAKMGIPQSVAREFARNDSPGASNQADIGNSLLKRRHSTGNAMKVRRRQDHDGRDGD